MSADKPIRVAQVMGKMLGGGVEAVVMNYYRYIDHSQVQFDYLVDEDSTLVPREEIEGLGGRVFEIPPYQHVFEYQRELQRLFRQEGWRIVHSHVNALSVFSLRAAKKAGIPVRIAHSHSTSGKGEHIKNAVKSILKTQANRYPTHRLACSRYAGEWLFGKGADFEVVYNAVDLSKYAIDVAARARIRCELGVSDNQLLIGHIGRFVDQKNHTFLLQIFKEILATSPDAVLALAGAGPLVEQTKRQASDLGIAESVRFLGQRHDSPALYQAFDVFCLPSIYEGLPVVGVECQASGTPILASTEVTPETAFTSLMEFEPLSSSPRSWARHLLAMRGKEPVVSDADSLAAFDIRCAAADLLDFYVSAIFEEGAR
ncbi:glycosyltransferase family 1 protein [Collinsella intestinalis]|uniref:glycosyltransferase family 1 protein n=1 Tax=Collinsella intestinalis TaxID=147207 RepID=UPI0025A3FF19|nr:glycosyltransferase family 1 protein [Collinsella intestinalis]MDM8163933.1 glycosyltransferase family 1 protein [Collinsella intestinalis]